jgi:hypothetical protein
MNPTSLTSKVRGGRWPHRPHRAAGDAMENVTSVLSSLQHGQQACSVRRAKPAAMMAQFV